MMNKDILRDTLRSMQYLNGDKVQENIYLTTRFVLTYIDKKFPNIEYTKEQKLMESIAQAIWHLFINIRKPIAPIDPHIVMDAFKKDIDDANRIEELKFDNVIKSVVPLDADYWYLKVLQAKLEEYWYTKQP